MREIALYVFLLICHVSNSQNVMPCTSTAVAPYNSSLSWTSIFPDCSDSSVCLVRTFQNDKLWREEWFRNNEREGISRYYDWSDSLNPSISEQLWQKNKIFESVGYFPNSTRRRYFSKAISDSTTFEITYYQNGQIKEYGNKKSYCPYGEWTELDSSGNYKWAGFYKFVNKWQKKKEVMLETGEEVTTVIYTCAEKDGTWSRRDRYGKVVETAIYVDGVIKKED